MTNRIGRFEIGDKIGEGGFGQVYKAFDPTVGRPVAIKVLTATNDPSMFARFRNEAAAAGNLHHPNIVTIHEFGEQDNTPYLVMEFMEGDDLQKTLKAHTSLSLRQKVHIMSLVAEGLYYAHSHGVLHRDVKPANIMLVKGGDVKIMDFGIARLLGDDRTKLTQEGLLIGTALYMAPELLTGANSAADALCDIWAYGVIYYELLAGKNPFAAGSQQAEMYQIVHGQPPALSDDVCPGLLQPVLERLLSKERELRYQSLDDLLFDTKPILLELGRKEAESLLPGAQNLCDCGDWGEASKIIRTILELDSQNAGARLLRERVQYEQHRNAARPRIEELIQQGETEAVKRNYTGAIEFYDSARRLDTTDHTIRERLDQLRAAQKRSDQSRQLVNQARKALSARSLTGAFESISQALQADPENADATRLFDEIQGELQAREREQHFQEDIQRASGLVSIEAFDEAISLLSRLNTDQQNRPEVKSLIARASQLRLEKERSQKFAADFESARQNLRQNQIPEAVKALERVAAAFPEKTEASDLLAYAKRELKNRERQKNVEDLSNSAAVLVQQGRHDRAIELVQQGLGSFPDEVVLTRLLRSILAGKREYESAQTLQAGLTECRRLRADGQWQEALRVVVSLLQEHSGDPELLEQSRQLQSERDRHERSAAVRRILDRSESLIDQKRPGSAVELLRAAKRDYPEEASIQTLLDRAETLTLAEERRRFMFAQLAASAEKERRQDWNAALTIVRTALERYPGAPELSEAEQRIQTELARGEWDRQVDIDAIQVCLDHNDWETAFIRIEEGRRQNPTEEAFDRLWNLAQRKKHEAVTSLVVHGGEALAAGQTHVAEELLRTVLMWQPDASEAGSLKEKIRLENEKRQKEREQSEEKRRYVSGQLALAATNEANGNWTAALNAVRKASEKYPGTPELVQAQERIELAISAERLRAIATAIRSIEEALGRDDWSGASQQARNGIERFPEENSFRDLLRTTEDQRRQQIETDVGTVRGWLRVGNPDQAMKAFDATLRKYSDDPAVKALAAEIGAEQARLTESLKAERAKRDFISSRLQQATDCERKRDYAGATGTVRKALEKYPEAPELIARLQTIEKGASSWAEQKRQEQYQENRTKAEALANKRDYAAAIRCYQEMLDMFPGDAQIELALNDAVAARDRVNLPEPAQSAPKSVGVGNAPRFRRWMIAGAAAVLLAAIVGYIVHISGTGSRSRGVLIATDKQALNTAGQEGDVPSTQPNPNQSGVGKIAQNTAGETKATKEAKKTANETSKTKKEAREAFPEANNTNEAKRTTSEAKNAKGTENQRPLTPPLPSVDCTNRFGFAQYGDLRWSGVLPPGEKLQIKGTATSHGSLIGGSTPLPGCPVDITVEEPKQPNELKIQSLPSLQNEFREIDLENTSIGPISSIRIHWDLR